MAEEVTAAVEEERELASQPIPGLVRKYTIVTGQGMLAQIIMVVLEGLVMGWGLGAHGLACVSIIMSVEYINLAFGNLFGTGVPAVVGNLLGAGDIKGASKAFSQGFWLTTIVSVLLAVVMAVFTEPICTFFGATPDIMADTVAGVRTFAVLLPLILTSLNRIDTISNAMELRGFGKNSKRTWYTQRPFARRDFVALGVGAALLLISLTVTIRFGRFYNPFL